MATKIRSGQYRAVLATRSVVPASITSVTLRAAVDSPEGFIIENATGSSILYLTFGAASTTAAYTMSLAAGQRYEAPKDVVYDGIITGIWVTAVGSAMVTSLT
jgi:hypothetical protein